MTPEQACAHGDRGTVRPVELQVENRATVSQSDVPREHLRIRVIYPEQRHRHRRARRQLKTAWILGIGDEVAIGGQGVEQLALGCRNLFDRAETLQVHRSDRGDAADLWLHE